MVTAITRNKKSGGQGERQNCSDSEIRADESTYDAARCGPSRREIIKRHDKRQDRGSTSHEPKPGLVRPIPSIENQN